MDTAQPLPAASPLSSPAASKITFSITLPTPTDPWLWVRIGIVALAAFLRLYDLELRPPHFDEGVNGWFIDQMAVTGFYKYDPTNYHGPLHFYVLFAFRFLFGRHLWALRLPIVLMGILTVDWMFRFERFFGRKTCAWAALAMTISPGFLYYQRDAIHETWLVFFLVLLFWGLFGLWQEGRRRYLWGAGLALSGMILSKETYVIHLGCLFVGVMGLLLLERLWPSRVALLTPPRLPGGDSPSGKQLPSPPPLFAPFAPQHWSGWDLCAVAGVGAGAIVLFYSGTGLNFSGLAGLVTTFTPWMHKAQAGEGHNKPFVYWLQVLGHNEPWAAFGFLACLRWAAPRTSDWRLRLLSIYAVLTWLAYSFIPYKTPWCVLSFAWPWFFIAGAALSELSENRPGPAALRNFWLIAAWVIAATLTSFSVFFAIRLNYFRPTAERGEEYVYVQTFPDVNRIVDPLLKLAAENPKNYKLVGDILCGSTYPLPWMLGDFPDIGYYSDGHQPPDNDADFLLVSQNRIAEIEPLLKVPYFRETVHLRSSLDPLQLYLRASLFGHLLPNRTPEFQPGPPAEPLSGRQVLPQ